MRGLSVRSPRNRTAMLALIIVSILRAKAFALDPTKVLSEFHHTQWTARDGAPAVNNAIAQTSDGYLWVGSETGLFQFDGARFLLFALADGSHPITSDVSALYTSPNGELWIGMRFGGAYVWNRGRLTHYGNHEGLPAHAILAFARRDDHSLWAQTTVGLYRLDGDDWRSVGKEWNYPLIDGYGLFVDRDGTLWSRGPSGTAFLLKNSDSFNRSSILGGEGRLLNGPDGAAWVCDAGHVGLLALSGNSRPIYASELGGQSFAEAPLLDRDHGLWALVGIKGDNTSTLVRVPDASLLLADHKLSPQTGQRLKPSQDLTGLAYGSLEDREGNIWFVTNGGIDRFRDNKLHSALESVPLSADMSLIADRGNIFMCNARVILAFPRGSVAPQTVTHEDVRDDPCSSIWVEPDGSFIIARVLAPLEHLSNNRRTLIDSVPNPKGWGEQLAIRDASGYLWVSVIGDALYRQNGSHWELNGGYAALPAAVPITAHRDASERLWFGYSDSRVAVVDHERVRTFGHADGLDVGNVLAIVARSDRVWVGGSNGTSLFFNGRWTNLIKSDGTGFNGVSGVALDYEGGLWLNASDGIHHIERAEVDAFLSDHSHRVSAENLNYEDGLMGTANQLRPVPTALEGGDGRIWFTTSVGAYWIDPKHISRNSIPPPVFIQQLVARGHTYPIVDKLTLPQHTTDVEIDFAALSLSIPSRVQFKYKLEGVDEDWKDSGGRRQAFYTNVSPGPHRFQVIAANEDGVWNDTGATATFVLEPAFYQTRTFYTLCGLLALLLFWQAYRARMRQVTQRLRREATARQDERERIARELHDTLLQSTQGLILLFQSFAARLARPDPMRAQMEQALDQADKLLNEARQRVGDLRTAALEPDISVAITRVGRELLCGSAVDFQVTIQGTAQPLLPSVADGIYRVSREALTNVARHANASKVEVEVIYEVAQFRVRIRDNGKGVADAVLADKGRSHHYGLQGMHERTHRMNGTFNIWSRESAGTEVEICVPAADAYDSPAKRTTWRPSLAP